MTLDAVGERIRGRREKLGLTQRDVAHALQVTGQAVSKWERGENAPDIGVLADLARLLGVSIDWLLGSHADAREVFEATVLVTDLQGFGRVLAQMSERDGVTWLNGRLFQVTEAALRYDVVPVKYIGDSFLGFFAGAQHRERAVRAALLARQTVDTALRVGMNSGRIYLGSIGHPEYAHRDIMGQAVDLAFRAAGWAKNVGSQIAATASVVDALEGEVAETLRTGERQAVQFPGIAGSTTLCEIKLPEAPA